MALSNLPHLGEIVRDNTARYEAYLRVFRATPWVSFADYSRSPGTYSLVLLKVEPSSPYTRDELIRILRAENALARPYYSPPLHRGDPPGAADDLPVSDRLSREFIQMPVGDLTTIEDIERMAEYFRLLDRESGAIVARLRSGP
jgi:dTDP-4-amino-4,6-dideoxygalactose transaminase